MFFQHGSFHIAPYKKEEGEGGGIEDASASASAEVHRGSLIMPISGHHSKASLRNYIGRPSSEKIRARSDILSKVLSGKSLQSLQPIFAALSSRAIFMFR